MMHTALSSPDIEADYVLWLERQIEIIRERNFAQLDIENLLDELGFSASVLRKPYDLTELQAALDQP